MMIGRAGTPKCGVRTWHRLRSVRSSSPTSSRASPLRGWTMLCTSSTELQLQLQHGWCLHGAIKVTHSPHQAEHTSKTFQAGQVAGLFLSSGFSRGYTPFHQTCFSQCVCVCALQALSKVKFYCLFQFVAHHEGRFLIGCLPGVQIES